jgi:hypothetical protein
MSYEVYIKLIQFSHANKTQNIYFLSRHHIEQPPGRQDMGSKIDRNDSRSSTAVSCYVYAVM